MKKLTKVVKKAKAVEPRPLPPIDLAASMKIVLEAIQNEKPKEKEEVADVIVGHRF